jgi:ATP-dependent Lon protease
VFRKVAVRIAEGAPARDVGAADLPRSSAARFESKSRCDRVPGVATGLAGRRWAATSCSSRRRACRHGKLILTGQLGDVMKESAQAALSLVKARSERLGIPVDGFEKADIHVHIPAGATPKDGPSAGVAMFVALASLLTGQPVRSDLAMTGEISLRGLVLPIGGVKEKVLAALRAGHPTVMLPARNQRDFDEIPAERARATRDRLDR